MRPFRTTASVSATALILVSCSLFAGCIQSGQAARDETTPRMGGQQLAGAPAQEETTDGRPEGKALSSSIPAQDARGEPVPGLPRHPGSVRVGYSEKETDGLMLVRAAYLTRERPDVVRGYYRSVFRAGEWQVANVEYRGKVWHSLVLRGDREAGVEVLPRDGGSEVKIELTGPAGRAQDS